MVDCPNCYATVDATEIDDHMRNNHEPHLPGGFAAMETDFKRCHADCTRCGYRCFGFSDRETESALAAHLAGHSWETRASKDW